MKDLITDEGTILTEENINTMYNIRFKPLEYNSLISAIPKKWKNTLKNEHTDLQQATTNLEFEIQINKIMKPIHSRDQLSYY